MALSYIHHNTPDDVQRYLAEAVEAVEAACVPDELREAAFVKAADLLAQKMAVGSPDVIPANGLLR